MSSVLFSDLRISSFSLLMRIFLISSLWVNINDIVSAATVQVSIQQGQLTGTTSTSRNGNQFYAFYSIPFAKPPVGHLRFRPPQEPEKWNGVRTVTTYPPLCPQQIYLSTGVSGEEDCLYLNVYTRQLNGSAAVLVFIHGGGFTTEYSGLYPPTFLMDHSVVYVTVQYRLGLLGFLSSGDEALRGNNGMKDQVMALKWIKRNIASFGGDPKNVILFGQSAGAGSVQLHMFSPIAKGLFHKGLSLSGSAFGPWSITPPHAWQDTFRTVVYLSGCSYRNISDSVQCLKRVPLNELILTQAKLYVRNVSDAIHTLGPTIEPNSAYEEAYLTKRPKPGEELNPQIPWMFGQTSAEGIYKVQEYLLSGVTYLNDDYRRLIPVITLYKPWLESLKTSDSFADDMKQIYFKNADISVNTLKPLVDLISDTYFTFGITRSAFNYKGPKYLYYDDYRLRGTKIPYDDRLTSLGVCHGVDLLYYFNYANITVTEEHDVKISENLVKMFVNFAYTGNPSVKEINVKWDPVENNNAAPYLHITDVGEYKLSTNFFREKYEIWKKISKYFE